MLGMCRFADDAAGEDDDGDDDGGGSSGGDCGDDGDAEGVGVSYDLSDPFIDDTCGRAVKLIAHKSERPDAGEGEFWDLQHQPIACVFKQDQTAFTLGADAAEPYAWSKDALVLQPVLAKFKWHPLNRDMPLTVWRRNIEASPALCFTNYKVIGATLKSVVIYLPNPTHLKGQKSFSLQHKLVMLSRTRRMKNLFFLCADDYDFDGFLREPKVPEVRAVHIRPVLCMN
eukprot:COSAG01_NODE_2331_length_7889_cov_49.592940_7_plen_228_part_00